MYGFSDTQQTPEPCLSTLYESRITQELYSYGRGNRTGVSSTCDVVLLGKGLLMPWQLAKRHLPLKKTHLNWTRLIFLELLLVLLLYSLGHTMGWIIGGVVTPLTNNGLSTNDKQALTPSLTADSPPSNAKWRQEPIESTE